MSTQPTSTSPTPSFKSALKKGIKPTLGNKTCLPIDTDEKEASSLPPTSTLIPEKLDGVLYFPISYFIWKRQLPPPTPSPISPPWCMFPKPRGKKVTSTSHLKWDRRLPNQTTFCWGGNDTTMGHSSHPVTMDHGVGVPRFQENGTWARYSHLLCPKPHYLYNDCYSNFNPSAHNLKPKGRTHKPKSGSNTLQRRQGQSKVDLLNGLGKTIPSEIPCRRKTHNSCYTLNSQTTSTISFNSTTSKTTNLPPPKSTSTHTNNTAPNTTYSTNTCSNISIKPIEVPYPMERTKWMRPLGGTLKGGGPNTSVTLSLYGSNPYYSEDARKLTINCIDSVMECSLGVIEQHSKLMSDLLQECGSCRLLYSLSRRIQGG